MSSYNQSGTHYDPVGSQANQPTGYTYQTPSGSVPYTAQATNNFQNYNAPFSSHQYTNALQQQQQQQQQSHSSTSTNLAAAALSSLSSHDYTQNNTANGRTSISNAQPGSSWSGQPYGQASYDTSVNRSSADTSSLYTGTTAAPSTFGRLTLPDQNATSGQVSRPSTTQPYQNSTANSKFLQNTQRATASGSATNRAYNAQPQGQQQQQSAPQRYASPLQAVQAKQHHQTSGQSSSRNDTNSVSPQVAARNLLNGHQTSRQTQAQSSGSAQATVDPSQVYDFRAEQQRKARIEAEKRSKIEAQQAARKAEQDRLEAERAARQAEQGRLEAERLEAERVEVQRLQAERLAAEEAARVAKEATDAKMEKTKAKRERARQLREEKKNGTKSDATSSNNTTTGLPTDEESQMRAMFAKMREFNARNPSMLAKLWDEERQAHVGSSSPGPATANAETTPVPTPISGAEDATNSAKGKKSVRTDAQKLAAKQKRAARKSDTAAAETSTAEATPQPAPPVTARAGLTSSPPAQAVNSLWPSHKKGSLSETAARWLSELPANQNVGKFISKHEVLRMVETNPSYVQLCELIEVRGIKFERSAFARELLKTMPDAARQAGNKNNSSSAAANASTPTSASQSQASKGALGNQIPALTALTHAANGSNGVATGGPTSYDARALSATSVAPQSVHFTPQPFTGRIETPSGVASAEASAKKPEEPPRPPPANKEEAARKRTFADLVDLTGGDSDDEAPPRKIMHFAPPATAQTPQQQHFSQPMSFMSFMKQNQHVPLPAPLQTGPAGPMNVPPINIGPFPSQSSIPFMPPGRLMEFPAPPPPANPRPTYQQLELERQQKQRMKGQMLVEPIMRDRVARKSRYDSSTIARDVLLATGRHPDMRSLNSHLNVMQKLLGDHGGMIGGTSGMGNRSDLSTIRWDIIDPGGPEAKSADQDAPSKKEDVELDLNIAQEDEPSLPAPTRQKATAPSDRSSLDASGLKSAKPLGAKRGRPTKAETERREQQQALPGTPRAVTATTTTYTSTPRSTPGMSNPVGYAAFAQTTVDANGNVVKKKGRPVGWRKSVHSREAQGLEPLSSARKPAAAAAATSTPKVPAPAKPLQEPHYQVYPCGWTHCAAELHNLDTLKKHAVKMHGSADADGTYPCRWQDCAAAGGAQRGFADIGAWMQHVDATHMLPVAWKLGDGPGAGEQARSRLPAYLSDQHGRSVTPIILPATAAGASTISQVAQDNQALDRPTALPDMPRRGRPPKDPALRTGPYVVKDERDAAAELKKLQDLKRFIGPSFGPEGTVLANAKRRRGFLDDEDFEDVVESED